jgi:hypothetical protein
VVYDQENGTSHLLLHAQVSDFNLQNGGIFSDKFLRSFRHVHSCTNMILYYAVEMYVYVSLILLPNMAQFLNFIPMPIGT